MPACRSGISPRRHGIALLIMFSGVGHLIGDFMISNHRTASFTKLTLAAPNNMATPAIINIITALPSNR